MLTPQQPLRVLTVFGTRPEVIKLAPVIRALEAEPEAIRTVNVTTGQHSDLLYPFIRLLEVRVDHDLKLMQPGQTPNQLCARALAALEPLFVQERPDLVLVQGDTTTALAAALAAFHLGLPVGHVEAGLRSGNPHSPFPEEMNRRLITRLATYHFAATARNRDVLLAERVPPDNIILTGNPVVDSLHWMLARLQPSPQMRETLAATEGLKRIVLTTHRRENFGDVMTGNLRVLSDFVACHPDTALIFPVHPNPAVRAAAENVLAERPRVLLLPPLEYGDFLSLMSHAWVIASDSGGVQEEAPSLGKPLLVLRANTERPEAVEAGVAQLVGDQPERLLTLLQELYWSNGTANPVRKADNPFGRGDSGQRIASAIRELLTPSTQAPRLRPVGLASGA